MITCFRACDNERRAEVPFHLPSENVEHICRACRIHKRKVRSPEVFVKFVIVDLQRT